MLGGEIELKIWRVPSKMCVLITSKAIDFPIDCSATHSPYTSTQPHLITPAHYFTRAFLISHRMRLRWLLFSIAVAQLLFAMASATTPLEHQHDFYPSVPLSRVPYGTDVTDFEPVAVISSSFFVSVYQARLKTLAETESHFAMRVMNRQWVLGNDVEKKRLEGELNLHQELEPDADKTKKTAVPGVERLYYFYNVCYSFHLTSSCFPTSLRIFRE